MSLAAASAQPAAMPLWTQLAQRNYYDCFAGLKHRVVGVVRTAVRRHASGVAWHDGKKCVQGLAENVYELRATAAHRVLVQERSGRLIIVDIGDHDIVSEYVRATSVMRDRYLREAVSTPAAFHPDTEAPLFTDIDDEVEPIFNEELDSSWLTFLSDEQSSVAERIADAVVSRHDGSPYTAFVRGGAGTGKTAILLNLAMQLHEAGIPVRLECSPAVTRHLSQHTRINVRHLQPPLGPRGVLLVDDPPTTGHVSQALARASEIGARGAVVAFDPLQWREKRLRAAIDCLPGVDLDHRLTTCYRQSSSLAKQAIEIVAAVHDRSSWRSDKDLVAQERQLLKELEAQYLAGLRFAKPGGRVRVVPKSSLDRVLAIEAEALRARWDCWQDMPALLVLEDRDHDVRLRKATTKLMAGISRLTHSLQDVGSYRGLDFQAAWIFMSSDFFDRIQAGKLGLGTQEWESLRDLHVAFTRAKDETFLFLI